MRNIHPQNPELIEAYGKQEADPIIYSEAWRYTGKFTRFNRFRHALPGFGIASVAFAAYCTYEHFFMEDDHHHSSGGHGLAT